VDELATQAANRNAGGFKTVNQGAATASLDSAIVDQLGGAWITDPNAWTFVTGSQFTIAGNQTATYVKGTKVKWIDTTGTQYGVVHDSSYSSPNTTVNLVATSDYTMVSNPTAAYYGVGTPPGFPSVFQFTPVIINGFSSAPSGGAAWWRISGGMCTVMMGWVVAGTSNAGSLSVTAPIASSSTVITTASAVALIEDNGTWQTGIEYIQTNSTTINFLKAGLASFTTSGSKNIGTSLLEYPI
jgi:hypothetical protein